MITKGERGGGLGRRGVCGDLRAGDKGARVSVGVGIVRKRTAPFGGRSVVARPGLLPISSRIAGVEIHAISRRPTHKFVTQSNSFLHRPKE